MKIISLKKVSLEGFKSFSASSSLVVDQQPGMVLVSGRNQASGSNGAGKTSLFQGLEYCLYGPPIRGFRISDLVSWGSKQAEVACLLDIDGIEHSVLRTGPPDRIFIDGSLVAQAQVISLVGLTRRQFLNSVAFGQAMPLFIDLPIPERGDLLDEVLDLQLWMRSVDKASKRLSEEALKLSKLGVEIGRVEGAISTLEPLADVYAREDAWKGEQEGALADAANSLAEKIEELEVLQQPMTQERDWAVEHDKYVLGIVEEFESKERELESLLGLAAPQPLPDLEQLRPVEIHAREELEALVAQKATLLAERARVNQDLKFFETTGDCPACQQPIAKGLADRHISSLRSQLLKFNASIKALDSQIAAAKQAVYDADWAVQGAMEELRSCEKEEVLRRHRIEAAQHTLAALEARIERESQAENPHAAVRASRLASAQDQISTLEAHLASLEAAENPHTFTRRRIEQQATELKKNLASLRSQEASLKSRMAQLEYWQGGFRRVRLFCLQRVLQQLDIETMNAAQALGLSGWRIRYATETETKSGTQKLGVQVEVQPPNRDQSFSFWSGGEGQRVRLCTAQGFSSLVQRWMGVKWRTEIYDEPTAFLDDSGIEDLLNLLRHRAEVLDKVIFVADHRGLQHAGFSRVITVAKGPEGSYIQ